ncbi:hypothetical protein ZWY2020_004110 [Hordeum vulgare]|nr:hypothetical protein ZWY2020_004110 [Hordeum vulgare]
MAADGGVPCACVSGKEEGLFSSKPKFRSPNPSAMDRGGRSDKSFAFLQAFAALSVVLYAASILSAFILSRWVRHHELHIHHLLPDLWFAQGVIWPPLSPSSSRATSPPRSAAGAASASKEQPHPTPIYFPSVHASISDDGLDIAYERLYRRISDRGCPTAVNDVERKQDLVGSSEMLVHVRGRLHPICVPRRSDLPEGFRLAVKKSKAEKNHNKPKRPSSGFFVFM